MSSTVIVSGARTPIGKLLGGLSTLRAADLGAVAISGALDRAAVSGDDVDYVIMGQVIQAGTGQNAARTASLAAGIPASVPAITLNKVCLSGLNAVATADQMIRAGECEIVVAGGMESMSQAPHLLPKSRTGITYGDATLVDSMAYDALWDQATDQSMGALTESCNSGERAYTREQQDEFAAASHRRAADAAQAGRFDEEIVEVQVPQRKGEPVRISADEGVRGDTTAESLGRLRPAFAKDGTITAGSASQISDGACAMVVMSKEKAEQLGVEWLAEIGAHGMVAGPDSSLQLQPARAIARACEKEGVEPGALDLIEINEAFAAVGLASAEELGVEAEKVNADGGAIALGHPLGSSGSRLVVTLLGRMEREGADRGLATMCVGVGQGSAMLVERV